MKKKNSIQDEINEFFEVWDCEQMQRFLADIGSIFELYNVDDVTDFVCAEVGPDDETNVRLIASAILISRFAENHSGILAIIKMRFKKLHERIEKASK